MKQNYSIFYLRRLPSRLRKWSTIALLTLICSPIIAQTNLQVRGTVTSETDGYPLIGVNVIQSGTTNGVVTDIDGNYEINVPVGARLDFSYIGFNAHQLNVVAGKNVYDVVMNGDAISLTETVVIGYGVAKKRDLTGSILSLSGDMVADKPSSNPLASIQGKASGVQVVNTGRAGQEPEIRIRGTNSINGHAPLYVVDGLFTDNINYLNPADVASLEILKDASSLAIFGIRGANGVIIITTKKAKEGNTVVNVNTAMGYKQIANRLPMANAAQFRELYNEQRVNQGITTPFDYSNWNADTNWQDEIFQTGFINTNNISVSSATDKSKFYTGLGYATEEGSIKSEKLSKLTLNLNSEQKIKNYLKVGFQLNGSRTLPPDAKEVTGVLKAAPIAPTHFDYTDPLSGETERLIHTMPDFQRAQAANPLRDIELAGNHNLGVNHRLAGDIFAELDFLKHFNLRVAYSLDYGIEESRKFTPIFWEYNPDAAGSKKTNVTDRETVNQIKSTSMTAQQDYILTYSNSFNKHGITGTLGITTNYREFSKLEGSRSQLLNEIYFSPGENKDKW
jgi:TonB-linked SusC/RagA family outer membrane protein